MTVHEFGASLAYSHDQADQAWWEPVYREAFPDFVTMVDLRQDGWHQRAGRDRMIVLTSGRSVFVDEKVRKKAYPDVALEIWSVYPKEHSKPPYKPVGGAVPGWAREAKDCEWLAYAFVPKRTCHLLPFLGVRRALEKYKGAWVADANAEANGFRWVKAENPRYDTISIAVPISVLNCAIADAMTITWEAQAA